MTNPTLERAARALYRADPENYGIEDDMWSSYVAMARAVLMAVREPDEALVSAMNSAAAFHACLEHHSQTDARMWRAAVDAILNDGEGE